LTLGVFPLFGACVFDPNTKNCVLQSGQYCAGGSGGAGTCGFIENGCGCDLPGFSLTISPFNPSPVKQGSFATAQVTVAPAAGAVGFLGAVSLSVSACPLYSANPSYAGGLACSISPSTVTSTGAAVSSTLQVATDANAPPLSGPLVIEITAGGSGGISQTTNLNVTPKKGGGGGGAALLTFLGLSALWLTFLIFRRRRNYLRE
jgi:hypothetical protein